MINEPFPVVTDPIRLPLYGASPAQAFRRFWRKYVTFSGRASRSEYWWWVLIAFAVSVVFQLIGVAQTGSFALGERRTDDVGDILSSLWGLAVAIPTLALSWRRLHDTNRSGLWILIGLLPVIGWIILLVFYLSRPKPEGARFDR
ncbi:Uncharacterized membrane protein YhaH, DUF805 family [Microlunatus sagamiharensis]|uniref:Uncharacterized membrane protein YhaH, DUF805 family n=1 Tax=Microlunatus sagamiharensis TaxID=546874 RepID=A0A1H2MPJ0_9ACTN|nr:DUF805 domain-containing protein [Microlunatus sagamiharensis]SDU95167.1 Uncharacterized membrane protein YhaH, DUF805 family [Microlunatus sagamiharensis]